MASPNVNPGGWNRAAVPTTNITDQSARVRSVQAGVVQHHYVRTELRDINVRKGDALVEATLAALQQTLQGRKCTRSQLLHGCHTMTSRLQLADLTRNIMSTKWFMTPNDYPSYTQMYERAVRTVNAPGGPVQQMRMTNGDTKNHTHLRIGADSKATFPSDMMNGGRFDPKFGGIGRVMNPGNLVAPSAILLGKYPEGCHLRIGRDRWSTAHTTGMAEHSDKRTRVRKQARSASGLRGLTPNIPNEMTGERRCDN